MIIMTRDQAEKVTGTSPTNGRAALEPVALKDGTFMLPESVLEDPAHDDAKEFLTALPRKQTEEIVDLVYQAGDTPPPVKMNFMAAGRRSGAKIRASVQAKPI